MVTIDLLFLLKFVFYLIWIGCIFVLGWLITKPMEDNLYTLGIELILRGCGMVVVVVILLLSILVYGGIYWW